MIEVGMNHEATMVVRPEHSARAVSPALPEVLASAFMIAFVEQTCIEVTGQHLGPGQATVGTNFALSHIAATPIGMRVRARVTVTEVDRRRLKFAVEVFDEAEKISEGTHERFIIDVEKFVGRVQAKARDTS